MANRFEGHRVHHRLGAGAGGVAARCPWRMPARRNRPKAGSWSRGATSRRRVWQQLCGWPQAVQEGHKENSRTSRATRVVADRPRGNIHPMQKRSGGTSLCTYWAQRLAAGKPWDFKVVSETTRRYGAPLASRRVHRRGLAVRLRRARTVHKIRQDR